MPETDQSQLAVEATNKLNLVKQRLRKTLDPELNFRTVDQSENVKSLESDWSMIKVKPGVRNYFQKVIRVSHHFYEWELKAQM